MTTAGHPSVPAGLLVRADRAAIARAFLALGALQPVRQEPEGLICAPRSDPEAAAAAIAICPLPLEALPVVPGWPDPPAAAVAGWYRRSPGHAPAPAGVRELIQVAGEGFGPAGHPTTALCLSMLELMPAGPALDAGCGSGLLAQAWARLERGPVLGVDLDARALDQAARSLEAAGLARVVTLRRAPLGNLEPTELAGRVILANVPAPAHAALLGRLRDRPPGAVLSGLRPAQSGAVIDAYRSLGMRVVRIGQAGGFRAVALVAG